MTSDPDFARRVTRLENDRDSTYELIDDFRAETRERFDQIDARFGQIDARFGQIDARLSAHDGRFDQIESTLTEVLRRLPEPS